MSKLLCKLRKINEIKNKPGLIVKLGSYIGNEHVILLIIIVIIINRMEAI